MRVAVVAAASNWMCHALSPPILLTAAKTDAAATQHNATRHDKQVIALSREQEVTKQQELKAEEAKFAAQAAAAAQEQERVRWEMQSKFAQEEAQRKAQLAQYEDELARK